MAKDYTGILIFAGIGVGLYALYNHLKNVCAPNDPGTLCGLYNSVFGVAAPIPTPVTTNPAPPVTAVIPPAQVPITPVTIQPTPQLVTTVTPPPATTTPAPSLADQLNRAMQQSVG